MFTGSQLANCATTDFSDGIFEFRVEHIGHDAWCMHSVAVELRDGDIVQCIPGITLDNDDHYICTNY